MRITVEFESLEEFRSYMEPKKEAHTAPTTCAPAAPVAIPWEEPQEAVEAKAPEAPEVSEDFRVEVRKTLAALNKSKSGNPAKALIAELGYKRLTDVPLEQLPGLMEKAKEALNA